MPSTIESKLAARVLDYSRAYWGNCDAHACTGAHLGRYQLARHLLPKVGEWETME